MPKKKSDEIEIDDKTLLTLLVIAIVGWYVITNPAISGIIAILLVIVFILLIIAYLSKSATVNLILSKVLK